MIREIPLLLAEDQCALVVRNRYDDTGMSVVVHHSSARREKQRAGEMRLIANVLEWAKERGISIAVEDGKPVVRG